MSRTVAGITPADVVCYSFDGTLAPSWVPEENRRPLLETISDWPKVVVVKTTCVPESRRDSIIDWLAGCQVPVVIMAVDLINPDKDIDAYDLAGDPLVEKRPGEEHPCPVKAQLPRATIVLTVRPDRDPVSGQLFLDGTTFEAVIGAIRPELERAAAKRKAIEEERALAEARLRLL